MQVTNTVLRRVPQDKRMQLCAEIIKFVPKIRLITHSAAGRWGWKIWIHYLTAWIIQAASTDSKTVDWISRSSTQIKLEKSSCNLIKKQRPTTLNEVMPDDAALIKIHCALVQRVFRRATIHTSCLPARTAAPRAGFIDQPHAASNYTVQISHSAFAAKK